MAVCGAGLSDEYDNPAAEVRNAREPDDWSLSTAGAHKVTFRLVVAEQEGSCRPSVCGKGPGLRFRRAPGE